MNNQLNKNMLKLLSELNTTLSPSKKLNMITLFFLNNVSEFESAEFNKIIEEYTNSVDKKRIQGEISIKRKPKHKNKKSTFKQPLFVDNYCAKQNCENCKEKINSTNAFRWMRNGEYYDYHATPDCFPEENRHVFEENVKYQQKFSLLKDFAIFSSSLI